MHHEVASPVNTVGVGGESPAGRLLQTKIKSGEFITEDREEGEILYPSPSLLWPLEVPVRNCF